MLVQHLLGEVTIPIRFCFLPISIDDDQSQLVTAKKLVHGKIVLMRPEYQKWNQTPGSIQNSDLDAV